MGPDMELVRIVGNHLYLPKSSPRPRFVSLVSDLIFLLLI